MEHPPTTARRARLSPEIRRGQLIEAAARLILVQGYLPIAAEKLSQAAGVSKALIYAYFPSQHALFNAVLAREFDALLTNGLNEASCATALDDAALACALVYFDHIARVGPIIHVILRDQFMAGRLDQRVASLRDRVVMRLALAARRELSLGARENIATITMLTTIPEEAGRLAHIGEMTTDRARQLCADLIRASLGAFRPRGG